MSDRVLEPKEAVCEALLRLDHASDIGVEVGVQADVLLRMLGEYGYAVTPLAAAERLAVVTLLAEVADERGLAISPDLLREAADGTLTTASLLGLSE